MLRLRMDFLKIVLVISKYIRKKMVSCLSQNLYFSVCYTVRVPKPASTKKDQVVSIPIM